MSDWKDKPHWTLRFNEIGMWDLVGPDYVSVPEFSMDGSLLFQRRQ